MPESYSVLDPGLVHDHARELAVEVLVGLTERPKRLSSRFFYDDQGSDLFSAICDLEEYYPTRTEAAILEANAARIGAAFQGKPFNLVDLGAGDGRKTFILLEHLRAAGADVRFVPIDISEGAIAGLAERTRERFPDLPLQGLVSEYFTGIEWLGQQEDGRSNLVLFLGSNIGNFERAGANRFLRRLWNAMSEGDRLLIGFDLKKDMDLLLHAYNDREGVTARFNLNLLERINADLGGHFELDKFRHFATYSVLSGAMESYLLSTVDQTVLIEALEREFHFKSWEPIHTEYSFKYLNEDVVRMAQDTGYALEERFWDDKEWFCDALWRVEKSHPR